MAEPLGAAAMERVQLHREFLFALADLPRAARISGPASDQINDLLNDMSDVSAATSLVARVLIARAILGVAAAWWNDLMPEIPLPETGATLRGMVDDPPPGIDSVVWLDPAIRDART